MRTVADHVALIREAARQMRERAEECGSFRGPWRFEATKGEWPTVGRLSTANDDDPHGLIASLWPSAGCGQHIASWHPGVALLVADLLEGAARREEEYLASAVPVALLGVCVCIEPEPGDESALALAVARAYLGRADG